jgi:cell wall-associated NlpC family hydrolase
MTTRSQVVEQTRTWVGTPYKHQAHLKGVGVDCIGLMAGVAVELGLVDAVTVFERERWDYNLSPDPSRMEEALRRFCEPTDYPTVGDWLHIAARGRRGTHVVLLASAKAVIHACCDHGRVVEQPLAGGAMRSLIRGYSFPGLDD